MTDKSTINWYCVDKSGMATLCADKDDALQNAKLAALDWPNNSPYRAVQLCEWVPAAQPDCRTCEHLSDSHRYCAKSEHWMQGCTNGDQYEPAPKVVLWRTE